MHSRSGKAGGRVHPKTAELACRSSNFRKSRIELGGGIGFYIDEKLINPGTAGNGAAFNFHEIDAMPGKWFECSEKRSRFVRKTKGERHF
jgi:hypothetical protein